MRPALDADESHGADEIVGAKMRRARKRHETPARRQRAHRDSVQLDVKASRALGVSAAAGQRRRIENDQVEAIRRLSHELAGLAMNELDGARGMLVQLEILPRDLERPRRRVDGDDLSGAACQRRERESALVAKRVEHARPGRERARNRAVVALIEKLAGLLAVLEINLES